MANNTIAIKVGDDPNVSITASKTVQINFRPDYIHEGGSTRFCAQWIYGPASGLITSISLPIAKYPDITEAFPDIPVQIMAFDASNTDGCFGLNATAASSLVWSYARGTKFPQVSIPKFAYPVTTGLPYITLSGLSIPVTAGTSYWLVYDIGYCASAGHAYYRQTATTESSGFGPTGTGVAVAGTYTVGKPSTSTGVVWPSPSRSHLSGSWDTFASYFNDYTPHERYVLINGESQVKVQFSLDNSNWSALEPFWYYIDGSNNWQQTGYKTLDITDSTLGGNSASGEKTVYVRFVKERPNGSGGTVTESGTVPLTVMYIGGKPVISSITVGYTLGVA